MEQIVYWNFVDGYAAGKRGDLTDGENRYHGGILRPDFSEKPAYTVLKKLIKEEWTTHESLVTDGSGTAAFRGFYGDYDVTVSCGGSRTAHSLRFSKKGDGCVEICI